MVLLDIVLELVVCEADPNIPIIELLVEFWILFAVVVLPIVFPDIVNWVEAVIPEDWKVIPLNEGAPEPDMVIPPIVLFEIVIAP